MMNFKEKIGRPTIHSIFFYSSKIILIYFFWLYLGSFFPIYHLLDFFLFGFKVSLIFLLLICFLNMGSSIKMGLPQDHENLKLKTHGMFAFSRNPIYTLFFIIILITLRYHFQDLTKVLLAIYTIVIHHFIVLKEEEYLIKKWGLKYTNYQKEVKRYGFF